MNNDRSAEIFQRRIGLGWSLVLFGIPAAALWLAINHLLPPLVASGWQPLAAWFAAGGLVFLLLLLAALLGACTENGDSKYKVITRRLRLRPLSASDWRVAAIALAAAITLTGVIYTQNAMIWPQLPTSPPFMPARKLEPAHYYLLVLWLPFFALNIVGEELWWRGYIQPRQEPVFGRSTWIVQGILHGLFHVSFGPGVLLVLLPVVFCIPWAVQRTRNTAVGIVVHGGINGPAFVAVNLGLL
jgi:membrane protease YdiL (CAAX protease family)